MPTKRTKLPKPAAPVRANQPTRNDVYWLIEGGNEMYYRAKAYFNKEFAPPPGLEAAFEQWKTIVEVANERLFPEQMRNRGRRTHRAVPRKKAKKPVVRRKRNG